MRRIIILLTLLMTFGLSSCVKYLVKTVKEKTALQYSVPPPQLYAKDGDFKGLHDFIQNSNEKANILLTHGLTDKTENHFDLMVERLAARLNLVLMDDGERKPVLVGIKTDNRKERLLGFDSWKLFEWKFRTADGKPVSFYFMLWSPITKPAKDFIHEYNQSIHRTRLSAFVKDSLFINIFGDLALYLNDSYKYEMQRAFLDALEHIKQPVAVVGGGFGVQLMFDAISFELYKRAVKSKQMKIDLAQEMNRGIDFAKAIKLDSARNPLGYSVDYDIRSVYLLTNQIPFVSLLTLQPNDPPNQQIHNDQVYASISNYCFMAKKEIDLVSFFDPNDAFGYVLPPVTDPAIHLRNVSVNVADTWKIDPKKTTQFVLPLLKKQKASDMFLGLIDQQDTVQHLMMNLRAPSELTRNDYRVIGALASGSSYKLVTTTPPKVELKPRKLEPREVVKHPGRKSIKLGASALLVKSSLQLKSSVLPFSLPSSFRDSWPDTIRSESFNGIDRSIATNDVTQVMTVHGVKNQEPDSFDDLVNSIAKSLGFYGRPDSIRFVCAEGETCPATGDLKQSYRPGTIKITSFEGVQGQKLIIYAVYWSSVTKPAKDWLDSISVDRRASVVPTLVKEQLINDGFADIELSFGYLRNKVDMTLLKAFKEMQADYKNLSSTANLNSYYLTGSLGTRLLLDFLEYGRAQHSDVTAVHKRTRTWYMITNQLIMTALKDMPLNPDGTIRNNIDYEDLYKATFGTSMLENLLDPANVLDVVAFNDPNDLLSFTVPDDMMGISTPKKKNIYNTYLNLTTGVNVNMDHLIKVIRKADRRLMDLHEATYDSLISDFTKKAKTEYNIYPGNPEFTDYHDMLVIAKERFSQRRGRVQRFAPNPKKFNPKIATLLKEAGDNDDELDKLFKKKKKWYSYNLYVTKDQWRKLKRDYKHKCDSMGRKNTIKKKSFRKLYKPGLIMPALRTVTNYSHYQDFVVDFGRAHVGAKENSKVVQMISHGLEPVTKTNVDQELYEWIHNEGQLRFPKKK